MFRWLRRFSAATGRRPEPDALLNEGLALAMDWGENWLAPIQGRLRQAHAHLQPPELDDLNASCQQAMKFGHETVHALVLKNGTNVSQDEFTALFLARYPWASAESTARLFSQSIYYAWKSGGPN